MVLTIDSGGFGRVCEIWLVEHKGGGGEAGKGYNHSSKDTSLFIHPNTRTSADGGDETRMAEGVKLVCIVRCETAGVTKRGGRKPVEWSAGRTVCAQRLEGSMKSSDHC